MTSPSNKPGGGEKSQRNSHFELALRNVMRLALQRRKSGFKEGDADHLLRFCASAGIVPTVLRMGDVKEPKP